MFCKKEHPDCLHKSPSDWEKLKSDPNNKSATKEATTHSAPLPDASQQPNKQQIVAMASQDCYAEPLNMLTPVNISSDDGNQTTVYAMLDNGSDTTYVTTDVIQNLKLQPLGNPEKVTMQTLNGVETSYRKQFKLYIKGSGPAAENNT